MLAFDFESAFLYLGNRKSCIEAVRLKEPLLVTAFELIDKKVDVSKNSICRAVIGTE